VTKALLVVDDMRIFPNLDAVYARTSREGLVALSLIEAVGGSLDLLLLDHDLGLLPDGTPDSIKPVVLWLEERAVEGRRLPIKKIIVISSNPVGAQMIEQALSRHYNVRRVDAMTLGAVVAEAAQTVQNRPQPPYPPPN